MQKKDVVNGGGRLAREACPAIVGKLRMPKQANFLPRAGSQIVFEPGPEQEALLIGTYVKFVSECATFWLLVERKLRRPDRVLMKVLAIAPTPDRTGEEDESNLAEHYGLDPFAKGENVHRAVFLAFDEAENGRIASITPPPLVRAQPLYSN